MARFVARLVHINAIVRLTLVWEPHMRGFIGELRHRNVFRVGIAYVVAGWLIAQVADLAADAFNAPEWFMQMLIIMLLIGLPIALFLAWAYELTPDGVKKATDLPPDAPKDPRSGQLLNRIIIAALIVAIGGLVWERMNIVSPMDDEPSVTDKSIAVLPFEDFSPDGDHAWFADGLTEEILNSLARTPDLQIASRTSSFAFRGAADDIPAIAAQLGVAHILEGSVRRAGDRLRVTAQLIRAADDKHLWSENFDGNSDDSIEIQERIAFEIASALETAMDPEELAKMMSAGTRSVEAWETYLHGLALFQSDINSGSDATAYDAIALLEKATEIDPGFAEAYLQLAEVWQSQIDVTSTIYLSGGPPLAERRARYRSAVDAAAKYARSDLMRLEVEFRAAEFDFRLRDQVAAAQAIAELAPDKVESWMTLGSVLVATGELDRARDAALHGFSLSNSLETFAAALFIEVIQRSSLKDVPAMVDALLKLKPTPSALYQSHRALLAAGLTERAAEVAELFLQKEFDAYGVAMVQMRQACAEGRVAAAEKLAEPFLTGASRDWLWLKTLGHDDAARDLLMPYDKPETLSILASHLGYVSFDASDYPYLSSRLASQGINRPPARPMAYRCQR
jgi:TolB-like protein